LAHDDLRGIARVGRSGFEVGTVRQIVAVNGYPEIPGGVSILRVWNYAPQRIAQLLGTGDARPEDYAADVLDRFENIDVLIETGDLLLLNGNLVHSVEDDPTKPELFERRTLVNI
jgi:hypothetical protein